MQTRDQKLIFVITMLEHIKPDLMPDGTPSGFPAFGCTRTVGYYTTWEDADTAVRTNAGDIAETCFEYAVIEGVEEGVYPITGAEQRWLYQRTGDSADVRFEPVATPEIMSHVYGMGIG